MGWRGGGGGGRGGNLISDLQPVGIHSQPGPPPAHAEIYKMEGSGEYAHFLKL